MSREMRIGLIILAHDRDDIDVEAFVQLSMQNMVLPVEIDK